MIMHTVKKAVQKDDTSLKMEYGSMDVGSNENRSDSSVNEQEKSELITEIIVWGMVVLLCILTL
jgi:hypothetical protein